MSGSKLDKNRKSLFDTFSTNWQLVRSHYNFAELEERINKDFKRAVVCPLCMRIFDYHALDQQSEVPLTLEHCPPQELGGKGKLLLCRPCNSRTGHDVDVRLMEYLQVKPFNNKEPQAKVRLPNTILKADQYEVKGNVIFKRENANAFSIDIDVRDEYRKGMKEKVLSQNEFQIIYKPHDTPSAHLVHIALLKIAYLLAFSKFGHLFVLNKNYDAVRYQILNPEQKVLPAKGVTRNVGLLEGFYLVKQPIYVKGILVVFPLTYNGKKEMNAVFLNHPELNDLIFYSQLKKYENNTIGIEKEDFRDLNFLTDKLNMQLYLEAINKPYVVDLKRLGFDRFY